MFAFVLLLLSSVFLLGCSGTDSRKVEKAPIGEDSLSKPKNKQKQLWAWRNHKYPIKGTRHGFETIIRFLSGHRYSNNPDFIIEIQKRGENSFIQVQEYLDDGVILNNEKPRDFTCTIEMLADTSYKKIYMLVKSLPIEKVKNKPVAKGTLYHDLFLGYDFFDKGFYREVAFNKPFPKKIWILTYEILSLAKFKTEIAKDFSRNFNMEFKKKDLLYPTPTSPTKK